jgi:hypothetical protein
MGPCLFFTRRDEPEPSFFDTARQLLAVPGFTRALCAFVVSIGVSNVLSAFIEETLVAAGISGQQTIDLVRPAAARTPAEQRAACWPGADRHAREGSSVSVVCHARVRARGAAQAGAGFQAAIVVGGIVLGGSVDRTKQYKGVTLGCLAASLLLLLPLGDTSASTPVVLGTLIALGALIGPVQPINAELAVEVRAADPTAACLADAPGSRPGGPYALSRPATRAPPRGRWPTLRTRTPSRRCSNCAATSSLRCSCRSPSAPPSSASRCRAGCSPRALEPEPSPQPPHAPLSH